MKQRLPAGRILFGAVVFLLLAMVITILISITTSGQGTTVLNILLLVLAFCILGLIIPFFRVFTHALEDLGKEQSRRNAEEELLKSERRYQTLAESSPVGIFHTDATGYTTYVNPRWCRISGMSKEDALGNGWLNAVHEDDREALMMGWEKATKVQHLSLSEYRFVRPDGSISWVLGQATPEKDPDNEIIGYVGTITDITGRKKAEEQIARILRDKETVLNRINDGMISVDNEWRYTFLNDAAVASQSLGKNEALGKLLWDVHPAMKNTIFWDKYHEAMSTRKVVEVEDYYEPLKTWFSVKIYPSHDGLTIFYTDISGKIMAQNEILKEKNLSDSIINSLPGIFYLFNNQGKYLRWNRNLEKVSGYSHDEVRQIHPLDFFDTGEKELIRQKITNTFDVGEETVQTLLLTKAKEKIPYYFTGTAIEYEGETCLMGVGFDFSERVRAEAIIEETNIKLRQLTAHLQNIREEERKRIGREIHDDLGQQLTAIKMDIAWIDKKTPQEASLLKEKLKNVIGLLDGSNLSIRRILSELRPGVLDERGLLEAIGWLGRQFTVNTGIQVQFTSTESIVKVPEPIATCIFRVYQEALTNITRYAGAKSVIASLSRQNDMIRVSIADDGKGFNPESVQTNKSFGILGMRERVLSLGGKLELISSPDSGTKIVISLPVNQS